MTQEEGTPSKEDNQRMAICLIGGTGRSGTTVLREIFSCHPSVATAATETRFLIDPDGLVDFYDAMSAGWSPYTFDAKIRRLERLLRDVGTRSPLTRITSGISPGKALRTVKGNQAGNGSSSIRSRVMKRAKESWAGRLRHRYRSENLEDLCSSFRELTTKLIDSLTDFSFDGRWTGTPRWQESSIMIGPPAVKDPLASFYRSFVDCVCRQQSSTHFVEDSPLNALAFDRILQFLPEARLVHIHRDPRDVVSSYRQKSWGPSDPVQAAHVYVAIMNQWERVQSHIPSETFLEIQLAELVADTEAILRRICDFWELDWSAQLLDTDLSHSNAGRWKGDIPPECLDDVEQILSPFMQRYGADT